MTKTDITKAAAILRAGGLVAFPTETVYGLGADASNKSAVRRIFDAKERPYDHPLIVHVATADQIVDWAFDITPMAKQLAKAFWPGPLTLILLKQPYVLDTLTGGQSSIGLRVPRHPIAQALLTEFGEGVAAPSANRFTHLSPTTAEDVEEELGGRVDLILDGGQCEVGLESTIIDVRDQPVILRPGMIKASDIETVLGRKVAHRREDTPVRTAGMHHLHYAPITATELIAKRDMTAYLLSLQTDALPVVFVTLTDVAMKAKQGIDRVTLPNDPALYAHELYHLLRELDHRHYKRIVIEEVPDDAAWDAIRDRLQKATKRNKA